MRPRRVRRRLKVAATSTIAESRSGTARIECQWMRWRNAENPASSIVLMKSGRAQNDIVSGEAKLSWMRCTVSSVGRFRLAMLSADMSGRVTRTSVSSQ